MSTTTQPSLMSLATHCVDTAAGTPVDHSVYEKYSLQPETGMNLARLQRMGKAYREGWLNNVLRRITPLTARNTDDYVIMADLFVTNQADAQKLLQTMSADLTAFAIAAGVYASASRVPGQLSAHVALYHRIAGILQTKFNFTAPAPFASSTVDTTYQAEMPFIRSFLSSRAA